MRKVTVSSDKNKLVIRFVTTDSDAQSDILKAMHKNIRNVNVWCNEHNIPLATAQLINQVPENFGEKYYDCVLTFADEKYVPFVLMACNVNEDSDLR